MARTTHGTVDSTAFDDAIKTLKEAGKYKGAFDAKEVLNLIVTEDHVRMATQKNESECVLARSVRQSIPQDTSISVGHLIIKILFHGEGLVRRFEMGPLLRKAVEQYDKDKVWVLKPGIYQLNPPTGNNQLTRNQSEDRKAKKRKRWDKFKASCEANGPTGAGINKHKSRSLSGRQVTILM